MKVLKIKYSWRYSFPRLCPFAFTIHNEYIIDPSYWYDKDAVPSEDSGWDKLDGLTSPLIHWNSNRIAIRPDFNNKGFVRYAFYKYVNGERVIKEIGSYPINMKPIIKIHSGIMSFGVGTSLYTTETYDGTFMLLRCQFNRKGRNLPKTQITIINLKVKQ